MSLSESIGSMFLGLFILMTPSFIVQAVMVLIILSLIYLEFFSSIKKSSFFHIVCPVVGIGASIFYAYAPIMQTNCGWIIAFCLFISATLAFFKYIKRQKTI